MIKDTLSISPTAGNRATDSNVGDITIEVHLKADYSDIEEYLLASSVVQDQLDNLNKLISKRIK